MCVTCFVCSAILQRQWRGTGWGGQFSCLKVEGTREPRHSYATPLLQSKWQRASNNLRVHSYKRVKRSDNFFPPSTRLVLQLRILYPSLNNFLNWTFNRTTDLLLCMCMCVRMCVREVDTGNCRVRSVVAAPHSGSSWEGCWEIN